MTGRDGAITMDELRTQGLTCTRCDLYRNGTQVVWGEGDTGAGVMVVGQGPGEQEAKAGRPFVGPSGELLNEAFAEAGIDRGKLWITNTIKHWATAVNQRGRLVNRDPKAGEVRACALWLEGELAIVKPKILVCIGAPAAKAVIDRSFKITQQRGQWFSGPNAEAAIATFHPSYLLRLRSVDRAAFERSYALVLEDLRAVVERAGELGVAV